MRTELYTLDREDLAILEGEVPDYVINRAHDPGYFTLGAVVSDGDEETVVGIAQFFINITPEGECFSEMIYVYVTEKYRHQGIGTKMVERVSRVLKKSSVKTSTFILPDTIDERLGYEADANVITKFFKECDYITAKDEKDVWITVMGEIIPGIEKRKVTRFVRFTGR